MIKSSICSDDTARLPHTPTRSRAPSGASQARTSSARSRFLKGHTVFNVEQIDGLPDHSTLSDFGRKRFGDEGYAIEELVAELGAAFLCASLELTLEPRAEHASYIQNWLTVLRNDNRAIFQAAADAQRAADFLHQLQPTAGEGSMNALLPLCLQRLRPFPPRRVHHSALASITTIFSGRRPRAACRLRTQNVFDPRARNTHDNVRSSIQST